MWELHSESSTLARPVVIRLVSYVNVPRDAHRRKITRRAVFARDSWTCQYCGSRSNLTVDHVIPRSKGGSSGWDNIVASCAPVQPSQGRSPAPPGRHAPAPRPAHAPRGDLHPRRQPDDPGGLAGLPPSGGLSQQNDRGRLDGRPLLTALTGKPKRRKKGMPEGPGPAVVSGRPGLDSAKRSSLSDLAAGHLQGPAKTVRQR